MIWFIELTKFLNFFFFVQRYWSCQLISPGTWGWVERTCYGDLVFNPNTEACDDPANVPGCVVPTAASIVSGRDE